MIDVMDDAALRHGSDIAVFSAEERPDLWDEAEEALARVWPEYNLHGDVANAYFDVLVPRFARFQILVYDKAIGRVVARGRAIPFRWDESLDDLPAGIDAVGQRALEDDTAATAMSALSAEVMPDQRERGLSGVLLRAMMDAARSSGLAPLVAPVRPTWKERYPLIPIEQYCRWRRDDGLPFDPWMRIHARLGGTVLRPEPRSMKISGTVEEWQEWTGMAFPDEGRYVFPGGLAPLTVIEGLGRYWEPNVWMVHRIR
jgi:GNAT superfamily N-acetyltransferase